MPKSLLRAAVAAIVVLAAQNAAAEVSEKIAARLRAAISANTGGTVRVDQINSTPIKGVYEVISDNELFYTDETGRYSFVGSSLIDTVERRDLTAEKLDRRMTIPFEQLPLKHAIKEVRGDGSQVFAVFEDPNCPICRVFTKFIDQIDNVTVYRFIFPVISPQSQSLARMAWCSGDRPRTWKSMMEGARPRLPEACDTAGLVDILRTGERFQINNTPTVVLANGKRLVGATPPEQFLAELDKGGRATTSGAQR
ncbi:DsbC family protein [Acidovorax sp. SUPP950]|uniref:DsbC family protein n=1 Tax=Acidovorax sp. SUPP950 TaxID=511901 RepID=UPI0023CC18EA|nr:DsbC family protein [Acidovorax sp. SUPP950]GKS73262.1 DsbC family protein [Acidovorax sp. SUPP950]